MIPLKKSLGQNLLINPGVINKIILSAELNEKDTVIEIGPGTGNLTRELVKKAGQVIAIEKDGRLISELNEKFKNYNNIKIIEDDVLKIDPLKLLPYCANGYKLIGNIPYYITSHLLKTIFEKWSRFAPRQSGTSKSRIRDSQSESGPQPKTIVLVVQKEVAEKN